jgi:branched-chain amino acid transport system substrate-binding protein
MEAIRNMDIEIPMLLPGIKVQTSGEEDGYPIQAMQIMEFNGENWDLQGEVIQSDL